MGLEWNGSSDTQYVLSLSYGKDSLACLGAIEELGWPLDRIVHAEVWATDTIPADLPPMVEFKAKADEIIKRRWGIEVERVCAMKDGEKLTYEKIFYRVPKRKTGGSFADGSVSGFPYQKGAWCNDRLKTNALDQVSRGGGNIWLPNHQRPMVQLNAQNQSATGGPQSGNSTAQENSRRSHSRKRQREPWVFRKPQAEGR